LSEKAITVSLIKIALNSLKSQAMAGEVPRDRSSKLIPGAGDDHVQGLQYRRSSLRKLSLTLSTEEQKPSKVGITK